MNLPGFPIAETGEIFSSVIARHLARSAGPKGRHLQLFGIRNVSSSTVVPHDLRLLTSIMPVGHPWKDDPRRIVLDHTIAPIFLHFAAPDKAATALDTIISSNSDNPAATLGLTANGKAILGHHKKYCPDCLKRDIGIYGFPVLYREHQPVFVRMCPVHSRPLHFNCLLCHGKKKKSLAQWQMAGRCECDRPDMPSALESRLDAKTEQGWLWLAQQVASILSSPLPGTPLAKHLRGLLNGCGFGAATGLDSISLKESLLDHFGESLLRQLGFEGWCDLRFTSQNPARICTHSVIDGARMPNFLGMLLLTRLVTDDISALANLVPPPSKEEPPRHHYAIDRPRPVKEDIVTALQLAGGKFEVAAKRLGLSSASLATDIYHHGLRVPLTPQLLRQVGAQRLAAIHEALKTGVQKREICERHGISEWALLRIQLDRPDLSTAHHDAVVSRRRSNHRASLLSFVSDSPDKSRQAFYQRCAASYDWLREHDREWLDANLPPPNFKARGQGLRMPRKDWPKIDELAASTIQRIAHEEHSKTARPIRLTRSRLLSDVGALSALDRAKKNRYVLALAVAEQLAETRMQFVRRTIRWALEQYVSLRTAISINLLRRVARLPATTLRRHRGYIIKIASELGLSFDARCRLAPQHFECKFFLS